MNWNIGIKIWWKGIIVLSIALFLLCIIGLLAYSSLMVFAAGLIILPIAFFISWPAIFLYSLWLRLIKHFNFPAKAGFNSMLVVPTSLSVGFLLWFCIWLVSNNKENEHFLDTIIFWIPLLCCIIAVTLCRKDILEYLQSAEIISEFSTE